MILVDTNLLVYAWDRNSPHSEAARQWLIDALNGPIRVALPWHSLLGFLRVVTNPRIYRHPETTSRAWQQVEEWLDSGNAWIPEAGPPHREILGRLLKSLGGGSKLIPDAHLAALAIEHGLTLCSSDGDFARFSGLKWENPLASQSKPTTVVLRDLTRYP